VQRFSPASKDEPEPIVTFGDAKLIRRSQNDYELVGGSEADRAKAKEWIALFMKGSKVHGLDQ
jgi:hypothetical protein